MTGTETLVIRLLDAVRDLREAQAELEIRNTEVPEAERNYRLAKSYAMTVAEGSNVEKQQAAAEKVMVRSPDGRTMTLSDWRYARDMAERKASSALEAVRSYRTIVSGFQSAANLDKVELETLRYGVQEGA